MSHVKALVIVMRLPWISMRFWLFNIVELPVSIAANGLDRHVSDGPMRHWIRILVVNPVPVVVHIFVNAELNVASIPNLDGVSDEFFGVAEGLSWVISLSLSLIHI